VTVRRAGAGDWADAGALLHRFNVEYDSPSPGPKAVAARLAELDDTAVFLAGDGPDGVAVVRMRRSIFTPGFEALLAELYVVPEQRRTGLGLALMEAVLAQPDVDYVHVETSDADTAACALYERCGLIRTEGAGGPVMRVYERDSVVP
jgi:GNAT superfamily N-acetyltransferase